MLIVYVGNNYVLENLNLLNIIIQTDDFQNTMSLKIEQTDFPITKTFFEVLSEFWWLVTIIAVLFKITPPSHTVHYTVP